MHCSDGACNMTSVLVMALCSQPEAFASDLSDDQLRYLYCKKFQECNKDRNEYYQKSVIPNVKSLCSYNCVKNMLLITEELKVL